MRSRSISRRASSTRICSTSARTTATSCSPDRPRRAIRSACAGRKGCASGADLGWSLSYAHGGEQQTHPGGTHAARAKCGAPAPGWFLDPRYELPSYGLVNARVRYGSADGRWALTLFAHNLTDENYANYATRFGGGFWDFVNPAAAGGIGIPERSALGRTMGRPREVGLDFRYGFGPSD